MRHFATAPQSPKWAETAVIVLAGGASKRMGTDKLAQPVSPGHSVLDAVLAGVDAGVDRDTPVVLVGPFRPTSRPVILTREDPPGTGPAAGVAAGVAELDDSRPYVLVLAGDAPFAVAAVPALLCALRRDSDADASVAQTPDGHVQPLLAAYRIDALRRAVAQPLEGRPVRSLLYHLACVRVPVSEEVAQDVDTAADLERARQAARRRMRS